MNRELGEAMSALMDGEADDQALEQVLDNVQDAALRDAWRRFHYASHSLQPGPLVTGIDLSERIAAAIDEQGEPSSDNTGEALSSLVDGEADTQALTHVLDNLQDQSLRDTWARFTTASHSLQPGPLVMNVDLSGRIAAAIEQEPAHSSESSNVGEGTAFGEALSVLMDGEADEPTLDQVLDNVQDQALRNTWSRFNTASHSLQSGSLVTGTDLSARIMAAIEQEPGYESQPHVDQVDTAITPVGSWQRFLRPIASFAVAASVFAVVLVGSQFYGVQQGTGVSGPTTAGTIERLSPTGAVTVLGGRANLAGYATPSTVVPVVRSSTATSAAEASTDYDAMARQRLEQYMLNHAEEASLNAPQGMMPYARVATFSTED